MTTRTRLLILAALAIGWFALAVVNLVTGRVLVSAAYAVCGSVVTALTVKMSKGRRARE